FLLRQIHAAPRLVVNAAGAVCTDTIHRVRVRPGVDAAELAASFDHPLTWAFAEVLGRSYGGGVLELEPTEAEALPVVPPGGGGLTRAEVECLRGIWEDLSDRRRPRRR
ncbi:MAG: class I SAM-dependent methyltransferase, partial [Acidimicrobiales bacterium]